MNTATDKQNTRPSKAIAYVGKVDPAELLAQLESFFVESEWEIRDLSLSEVYRSSDDAPGPWYDEYILVLSSVAQAREILPLLTAEGAAKKFTLSIQYWGDGSGLTIIDSSRFTAGDYSKVFSSGTYNGYKIIQKTSSTWKNIHESMSDIVGLSHSDLRVLPLKGVRLGVVDASSALWAVGDPQARWIDSEVNHDLIPVVDSVDFLTQGNRRPRPIARLEIPSSSQFEYPTIDIPPIDPVVFSPQGFNPFPSYSVGYLYQDEELPRLWSFRGDGDVLGRPFAELDENVVAALRDYRQIRVRPATVESPWSLVRILAQLMVSGVPAILETVRTDAAEYLGPAMSANLSRSWSLEDSPTEFESNSIDMRRVALTMLLPDRRFRDLGLYDQRPSDLLPSVSIVLATRRPSLVPSILKQIGRQTYQNLETVLAIHGNEELPSDAKKAIEDFSGEIRVIQRSSEMVFGGLLNEASALASGEIITKMDDDDWYASHHIEDLVLARVYSGAVLVGSPVQFSYLEGLDITTRRHFEGEQYTNHIAGGTMMIAKTDLLAVGGWRPVPSAVDRGLIDAVRLTGGAIYRSHGQNYVMHRRSGALTGMSHTWDAGYGVFLNNMDQQWDGLVLPSQFNCPSPSRIRLERSDIYQSIFSAE